MKCLRKIKISVKIKFYYTHYPESKVALGTINLLIIIYHDNSSGTFRNIFQNDNLYLVAYKV